MMRPWYLLKVGEDVLSETDSFTDVLVWSSVYLKFGLPEVQIVCTLKEVEE